MIMNKPVELLFTQFIWEKISEHLCVDIVLPDVIWDKLLLLQTIQMTVTTMVVTLKNKGWYWVNHTIKLVSWVPIRNTSLTTSLKQHRTHGPIFFLIRCHYSSKQDKDRKHYWLLRRSIHTNLDRHQKLYGVQKVTVAFGQCVRAINETTPVQCEKHEACDTKTKDTFTAWEGASVKAMLN